MTPERLAEIHQACFTVPRPWTGSEFADLLQNPAVFVTISKNGFAMGRIAGPEVELLTIAILPQAQNLGEGYQLMLAFIESAAQHCAQDIFLEVAETNNSALRLYERCGFQRIGLRGAYYHVESRDSLAAIVMKRII